MSRAAALVLALLASCGRSAAHPVPLVLVPEAGAELAPEETSSERRSDSAAAPLADAGPVPVGRDDPAVGDRLAPVTLVVFSDLQCPYCADFHAVLSRAHKRHEHDLRIVFKHSPLPFHAHARRAAELAVAVRIAHGERAFWLYLGAAFQMLPAGRGNADDVLHSLHVDEAPVLRALASGRPAQQVDADLALSRQAGVSGTPGSFVNGWPIRGAVDDNGLEPLIDRALDEAKAARAAGISAERLYSELSKRGFERARAHAKE